MRLWTDCCALIVFNIADNIWRRAAAFHLAQILRAFKRSSQRNKPSSARWHTNWDFLRGLLKSILGADRDCRTWLGHQQLQCLSFSAAECDCGSKTTVVKAFDEKFIHGTGLGRKKTSIYLIMWIKNELQHCYKKMWSETFQSYLAATFFL